MTLEWERTQSELTCKVNFRQPQKKSVELWSISGQFGRFGKITFGQIKGHIGGRPKDDYQKYSRNFFQSYNQRWFKYFSIDIQTDRAAKIIKEQMSRNCLAKMMVRHTLASAAFTMH